MATSILPSPIRLCPMDRCDLSPAKRIAIRTSQYQQRPSTCSSVELVDIESTASISRDGDDDASLVSLLRSVPQKKASPSLKKFLLYGTVAEAYSSLCGGRPLPAHTAQVLEDRATKRRVYQALFEVMHHHKIIDEMLIESSFYSRHFDLHSHRSLVLVMAYDFQKEKFNVRLPRDDTDGIPEAVVKVSEALWKHKVKLSATLAKMRVKENAQSITDLIPNASVRERYIASMTQPCYARVNMSKVKDVQEEVVFPLQSLGYTEVATREQFQKQKRAVRRARRDLLEFSVDCRGTLDCIDLVKDGLIVLQDIESYNFVEGLRNHLESLSGDVIITHCNAGVEAVHIASILSQGGNVLAFSAEQRLLPLLNDKITTLGLNNLQFIQSSFSVTLPLEDEHLDNVDMIVCLPHASTTQVSNAVDFLLQEEDSYLTSILREWDDVSHTQAPPTRDSSNPYKDEQLECLQHALTFTQVDYVVYATRSTQEAENGAVVRRALDHHSESEEGSTSSKMPLFHIRRTMGCTEDEPHNYYVAFMEPKPPERPSQSANDVIQQAIAKGILDGSGLSNKPNTAKPRKKLKPKRVFSRYEGIPMTISAQRKIVPKKEHSSPKKVFR